jgi:hypothetical protein
MKNNNTHNTRLTIDIGSTEHTFLKLASAKKRVSIRKIVGDYINEIINSVDDDNLEDDMKKYIRLSVDVNPKYHKKIKTYATTRKMSIREFVINCIDMKFCQMEIAHSNLTETPV